MANNMKNILFLLLLSTSALAQSPFYNDVVRANTLSPARVANALDVSKPLASTGTNTYTFSAPFTGFTYHTGDTYTLVFGNANSSTTVTANIATLGALAIKDASGADLGVGDLKAGGAYKFYNNGTHLRLIGASDGGGAFWPLAGAADITAYTQVTSTETGDPTHQAYIFADEGTIGFTGDFNGQTFSLSVGNNEAKFTDDRTTAVGLEYAQDYSADFVNRSLVDKEYVDNAVTGGSVADGDKGDITVSGTGATWTIDNSAVTNAKINDVAVGKITGLGTSVATWLATPSSANARAAVTDESGTGAMLFAGTAGTNIANTPAGNLAATEVQAAINELDNEKLQKVKSTVVHAADFSLALTDLYNKVQCTKATAQVITIPTDGGGTNWEVGDWIFAEWYGVGQQTFAPAGGVTIHSSSNTLVIPGQYSIVYLEYVGSDVWTLQNGSPALTWTAYTPTVVGFSGSPTYNFRYLYDPNQKRCTISFQMASSTSNATTFTITTPITSAATFTQTTAAQVQNNSTFAVGVVSIPSSSTTITVSQASGAAWTASGLKAANFSFTYETQ